MMNILYVSSHLGGKSRVDWLALPDDDITTKFPILLEGILQDVFSQRASSAWQGAQPQKITVSLLLPGTSTGEAPPERRTIYFIFTDPVLGAIEGVTVLSKSDLKQDARSCVRSVKIQKLYQSFMVSHQWNRQGRHHLPLRRLGLVAVSVLGRNVVDARGIEVVAAGCDCEARGLVLVLQ